MLKEYIEENKTNKIDFYLDLETYQYNLDQGKDKPSLYKNMIYSLAVTFFYKGVLYYRNYYNLKDFIDELNYSTDSNKKYKFNFIAHNGFKYDFHFLRWEFIYYYNLPIENLFVYSANDNANANTSKIKGSENVILEKRVKSANNLDMVVLLNNFTFYFEDSYLKTGLSLELLGKKLLRAGVIDESKLKTTLDYTKYDRVENLSDEEAKRRAKIVFYNLTDDEKVYIYNDVYILAYVYQAFNVLFPSYDKSNNIYTQNILNAYNTNSFSSYQLLLSVGKDLDINYSEYDFDNENLYMYLKKFYKGGLNFYNDRYIGKLLNINGFAIDINSSYPFVMYTKKIPTFIHDYYEGNGKEEITKVNFSDDFYTIYKISRKYFDELLGKLKSMVITKMLVKYYNSDDEFIYININTLRILNDIAGIKINKISCYSYITFLCRSFGSRNVISDNYYVKQQGKSKYKLDYKNPLNITPTKVLNDNVLSNEEVSYSKVVLNGIYGLPALRAYFNIFRYQDNDYINFENGYKNKERNIVFSLFVTSYALYNLLLPFKFLTWLEIDTKFLYCDTDSLYFSDYSLYNKIPDYFFNPLNLGAYGVDSNTIKKFYVLNHKKYCYEDKDGIHLKCGGVPLNAFDTKVNFDYFVNYKFSKGIRVKTNRSILNSDYTISIYPTYIDLDVGGIYPTSCVEYYNKNKLNFEKIKKEIESQVLSDDALYIESPLGAYSISDLYPIHYDPTYQTMENFMVIQECIKKKLDKYIK